MRQRQLRICSCPTCRSCLQSDKVLQNTIATLKELEGRCNASVQQGDLMAGRIEEIQHRMGIIQQAMLPPKLGNAVMPDDQDILD